MNSGVAQAAALAVALMCVASCGGSGSDGAIDDHAAPLTAAINADPVRYGESMRIELSGPGINETMSFELSGACEGRPATTLELAGRLVATCVPDLLGPLSIVAQDANGATIASRTLNIEAPIVAMSIGAALSPSTFEFRLDPGDRSALQRPWVDLFLHRLRADEYNGTVLHELIGGVRLEGGCYVFDQSPRAKAWSAPPMALEQRLAASNAQYTIAMSAQRCPAGAGERQPGIFAINLADNAASSGQLTPVDDLNYVVIGRLERGDERQLRALADLPREQAAPWLLNFPAEPSVATLRSLQRKR
jgi:hypothetical protein